MMYRLLGRRLALCLFTGLIPLGAAATMALPGAFGVDQGGAATYTIPIQAPPGTAGIEPALALTYNSQNGNGLLGMGWSLSGLPVITRCVLKSNIDGKGNNGINLDYNDPFCMNGQRLMSYNNGSAIPYGGNGAEYRHERTDSTKVMSFGTQGNGPTYFMAWTGTGQTLEFGNTSDSRIVPPGNSNNIGTVFAWALNKISDAKGNTLTITYTNDSTNIAYYPKRIDYTSNTSSGLTAKNSVQFSYAARPDLENAAAAKAFFQQPVRLTNIKTYRGATLIRDYRLAYQAGTATGRSQLASVTQCDGAATPLCLPPVSLTWQDAVSATLASGQQIDTQQNFPANPDGTLNLLALDIDGDGKTDLVQQANISGKLWLLPYFANGTGYTVGTWQNTGQTYMTTPNGPGLLALDLNGDGKKDLVQYQYGEMVQYGVTKNVLSLMPYVSTGTGFKVGTWWQDTNPYSPAYADGPNGPGLFTFNLAGGGRIDLMQQVTVNGHAGLVPYIPWTDNYGAVQFTMYAAFDSGSPSSTWGGLRPVALDMNDDGRMELNYLQVGSNNTLRLWTFMNNFAQAGGPFTMVNSSGGTQPFPSAAPGETGLITLDLNGDRKMDLVAQANVNGTLWLYPYYADGGYALNVGGGNFKVGTGFNTGQPFASGPNGGPGLLALDLNGDGKMDLVQQWNNNGTLWLLPYLASGAGFAAGAPVNTGQPFLSGGANGPGLLVADVNGDGKQELVQQWNNNGKLSLLPYLAGGVMPDLVTAIDNGLGAVTTVVYKPLTDASVYTKDSGANAAKYPITDLQEPVISVVASVTSPDGIGGTRTTGHAYGGLKHNWQRKERQGFRWVQSIQAETGLVSRTDYRQDFPYSGLATLNTQTLPGSGSNGLLKRTANTYSCFIVGSSPGPCDVAANSYFVYLSQSLVESWDLNGAVLPTTTTTAQYDSYGNPTQTAVSSSDGHSTTTVNTYKADTVNWTIRQLTRSTVTSTAP